MNVFQEKSQKEMSIKLSSILNQSKIVNKWITDVQLGKSINEPSKTPNKRNNNEN